MSAFTGSYTHAVPTAVIDLGSNSARLLVADVSGEGHLRVMADARSGLRLLRRLQEDGTLPVEAMRATTQVVAGLAAIARNAGAQRLDGVATAALRDATNSADVAAMLRQDAGVDIRVIDGDEEARLATRGAVHGLPVEEGLSIDIGGGSLEIASFTRETQGPTWSMPLGALRLNDRFLAGDPPKKSGIQSLCEYVKDRLGQAEITSSQKQDYVGTGGTIRAVAKIARSKRRAYPVKGVHGYRLTREEVAAVAKTLEGLTRARIEKLTGVNADRAVSITAGTFILLQVMEQLNIDAMLVSGKGLREGLALTLANAPTPSSQSVRQASVEALAGQFTVHSSQRASWRSAIARALLQLLVDDPATGLETTLRDAANLLDIGRSVDFYEKHAHTVDIILTADLAGFTQYDRAMVAAAIETAGDLRTTLRRYNGILDGMDLRNAERAGLLLALADGIEPRTHANDDLRLRRVEGRRDVSISVPLAAPWQPAALIARARRVFGKRLIIDSDGDVSIEVR